MIPSVLRLLLWIQIQIQIAMVNAFGADNTCSSLMTTVVRHPTSQTSSRMRLADYLPPLQEGSKRLYLIRHGETDWNRAGKIQGGGYDIALNDNGRRQAEAVAEELKGLPIGVVASSHLKRATETADIIARKSVTIRSRRKVHEGFGEMRFGEFEGIAHRSPEIDPGLKQRFLSISKEVASNVDVRFPGGGESTRDVQDRFLVAIKELLEEFDEDHVAVVAHGRTNKVGLAALCQSIDYDTLKQDSKCYVRYPLLI